MKPFEPQSVMTETILDCFESLSKGVVGKRVLRLPLHKPLFMKELLEFDAPAWTEVDVPRALVTPPLKVRENVAREISLSFSGSIYVYYVFPDGSTRVVYSGSVINPPLSVRYESFGFIFLSSGKLTISKYTSETSGISCDNVPL